MMMLQTIVTLFLLRVANAASNFTCSSTGNENGTALPALTVCRNATTRCDEIETCDGESLHCPANQFKPAGTVIRPSTSTDGCDPAEVCTGIDAVIPPDVDNCTQVAVDILGQSGKFSIFDKSVGKADANTVTVEVDALRELDATGDAVGTSGAVKHSVETFASQDFVILPALSTQLDAVSATMVSFSTPISSIGKLQVDTYILKNSGTIGTDTESWEVRANDVKFNIILSDWKWCGEGSTCKKGQTDQNGEFIDVLVKVKGKAAMPEKKNDENSGRSYELGGNVSLELSDRVLVDGTWTAMPTGFPKMEIRGSAAIFIFRFPKFADNATYDPVIGFSASLPEDPPGTTTEDPSGTTTKEGLFVSKASTGIKVHIIVLVLVGSIALWAMF